MKNLHLLVCKMFYCFNLIKWLALFIDTILLSLIFKFLKTHVNSLCLVEKYGLSRKSIVLGRILGAGFFGEVYEGVYKKEVNFKTRSVCLLIEWISCSYYAYALCKSWIIVCLNQNGEKLKVAVKTCKECSPDIMEKFLSEAGRKKSAKRNHSNLSH